MIKLGALYLFQNKSLAAWHWPWSITWRWIFTVKRHCSLHKLGLHHHRGYKGFSLLAWNNPFFDLCFYIQENMRRANNP